MPTKRKRVMLSLEPSLEQKLAELSAAEDRPISNTILHLVELGLTVKREELSERAKGCCPSLFS
ncbi:MAG: hypothetical protein GWP23_09275 [Synechococcales cyanobacterium H12SWP_bin.12]|nr:hypothetical protein [Synechococcales cyanobacterium H12SWP_bin.12]